MARKLVLPVLILVFLAAVLLDAGVPRRADAVLCKRRSGAVVSRVACRTKQKEVELDLAALGATGPPGDPGVPGASAIRLRPVDANGTRFDGFIAPGGGTIHVVAGHAFLVDVRPDGLQTRATFEHEGAGCQGMRLIASPPEALIGLAHILGTTAYYAGEPIAAHTIGSRSFSTTPSDCATQGGAYDAASGLCCIDLAPEGVEAGPAIVEDLSGLTPPFHVEEER
jgi:hypothetical protein